jgi:uncharacterized membrane protein YadS
VSGSTDTLVIKVSGAWIGSTVDNTGNVVVAAQLVGEQATEVAGIVKMMQVLPTALF